MADIDDVKSKYIQKLQDRSILYEQMKPINKEIKQLEKSIKTYMTENDIESLVVGPHEFTSQTKKRLRITVEDLQEILPEGVAIDDFLHESSSISKKRTKRETPNTNSSN